MMDSLKMKGTTPIGTYADCEKPGEIQTALAGVSDSLDTLCYDLDRLETKLQPVRNPASADAQPFSKGYPESTVSPMRDQVGCIGQRIMSIRERISALLASVEL